MGTSLALKKPDLDVVLLLRDPYLCHDINSKHINSKYLAVSRGADVAVMVVVPFDLSYNPLVGGVLKFAQWPDAE